MIFSTLAAISDYDDDLRFNFSPSTSDCKSTIDTKSLAGQMSTKSETVRAGSRTIDNDESARLQHVVHAILNKVSRTEIEASVDTFK